MCVLLHSIELNPQEPLFILGHWAVNACDWNFRGSVGQGGFHTLKTVYHFIVFGNDDAPNWPVSF